MKRWGRVIVLYLALGAVVNVGVAWALQRWGEQYLPDPANIVGSAGTLGKDELRSWHRVAGPGWPDQPRTVWVNDALGSRCVDLIGLQGPDIEDLDLAYDEWVAQRKLRSNYSVRIICRGLPVRSMAMEEWYEFHFPTPFQRYCNGVRLGSRFMPSRPLWPGFLANTVIYAAALWLLTLVPRTVKRSIRRHRHRCIACGYDLRGTEHEQCPECGRAVAAPSPRRGAGV
jgi:hypothetical protein